MHFLENLLAKFITKQLGDYRLQKNNFLKLAQISSYFKGSLNITIWIIKIWKNMEEN